MPFEQARNTDTGVQYVETARSGEQALSVDHVAGIVFLHDDPSLRLGASNAYSALRAETATKRLLFDRAMGKWESFTSTLLPFLDHMVKKAAEFRALPAYLPVRLAKFFGKIFFVHV